MTISYNVTFLFDCLRYELTMSSTPIDTEIICNSFPNPTLRRIREEPLLQHIITNHRLQCENAASLTYFGQHGLLAAIFIDAQYVAFTGAAFVPIANPGPICPPPPASITLQKAASLLEAHKTNKYRHTYWIHALRVLKRQWKTCIERWYIAASWGMHMLWLLFLIKLLVL